VLNCLRDFLFCLWIRKSKYSVDSILKRLNLRGLAISRRDAFCSACACNHLLGSLRKGLKGDGAVIGRESEFTLELIDASGKFGHESLVNFRYIVFIGKVRKRRVIKIGQRKDLCFAKTRSGKDH
jgi:hypothetical protein